MADHGKEVPSGDDLLNDFITLREQLYGETRAVADQVRRATVRFERLLLRINREPQTAFLLAARNSLSEQLQTARELLAAANRAFADQDRILSNYVDLLIGMSGISLPAPYVADRPFEVGGTEVVRVLGGLDSDPFTEDDLDLLSQFSYYLSEYDETDLDAVRGRSEAIARYIGFERFVVLDSQSGSIWQRFKGALKSGATAETVIKRVSELEQRLSLMAVGEKQAEVDSMTSSSIANLIASVEGIPKACLLCGSILLVKFLDASGEPVLLTRTLSPRELRALDKFPGIQSDPPNTLGHLAAAVQTMLGEGDAPTRLT